MNNAVRLILNESFVEKRDLGVPWIVHGTHWIVPGAKEMHLKKKKKKTQTLDANKLNPNGYLMLCWWCPP